MKTISHKGNPARRNLLQSHQRIGTFQVLLTMYDFKIKDHTHLARTVRWVRMIINQGHRIKTTQCPSQACTDTDSVPPAALSTYPPVSSTNSSLIWHVMLFHAPKSDNKVLILSTRAGGRGLHPQM